MADLAAMGARSQPVAPMTAVTISIREKFYPASNAADEPYRAIEDIEFEIADEEFVCVLGPSGCGKTTLLNLIAGLDTDFRGEISIGETERRNIGYVFQTPRLLPWRSALENVALVLEDAATARTAAMNQLASVGMAAFAERYPGQLSLGMQRRVALARAFVRQPGLLLMDEPFTSLDPETAQDLRGLLKNILKHAPAKTLFVTHDHREAVQLADKLVVLSKGPARVKTIVPVKLSAADRGKPEKLDTFIHQYVKFADDG